MLDRNKPIITEQIISLKCGRNLAYSEYGLQEGQPIIFFSGAGFGRHYIPTPFPHTLVAKHAVRFITVDRPGYGQSSPHSGRTYTDWVGDVVELMEDHLSLREARFLAHSAGTPHLAAVCALAPDRVIAASFVCPVSPITGKAPVDRPPENFSRGCGRFCLLHCSGVLDRIFGSVFQKWQDNPTKYVNDSMTQVLCQKDVAFMKEHADFQVQHAADFGDAVCAPNGVEAMLEDMFHINQKPWEFRYSDVKTSNNNNNPIQVWWGGADDTAPHGKWICKQLGVEGECIIDAGHGLIHTEFDRIVDALLMVGS
uniref:AB hydrolase-1 domain-containing protein n=1 Tax=Ditylum brightwellii TaxID=49249 RepID=A0A7S4UZW7_9STRA|mmetsp:Transcript_14335/g.19165  ORF Transcript_14335/g.19165 Transcript_14335/m.19165 type:complete len:311 (-) Transcript_14335:509-1441(-)